MAELELKIADMNDIIANESRRRVIVRDEMQAIAAKYNDARRTQIEQISGEMDIEDLIPEGECVITLTQFGYVKRQNPETYQTQHRGGRGISGMQTREEDVPIEMFIGYTHDWVLFFSNLGRVYRLKGYEIPEGGRAAKGINIVNLLPLLPDERITNMILVECDDEETLYLTMITRQGVIKRTELSAFDNCRKRGLIALTLREGDELVRAILTDGSRELVVATLKGMAIRFSEQNVRVMGRTASGVRCMRLREDDIIVGMSALCEDCMILTVSENGFGRLSPIENYRVQSRGGKGIIHYRQSVGDVAAIRVVAEDDDIILINEQGVIIRVAVSEIRVCARPSKGVRVMRVADGGRIVALAVLKHSDDEETVKLDQLAEPGDEDEGLTAEELLAEQEAENETDDEAAEVAEESDGGEEPNA